MSRVSTARYLKSDVVVAGGGMAGVCAAIAAARHGARVVLIQDRPMLGGNASSEIRMTVSGADVSGGRPNARETGILEELRLENAVRNPQRCAQMWDLLLWEWVTREPNITLLLNTSLDGAIMAESPIRDAPARIAAVTATRTSTEDRFTIRARIFVDCTGDGRLGAEAGADYVVGREGKAEYGERSAPNVGDRLTLGSSILFQARDYGRPMPFRAPDWIQPISEEDLRHRPHQPFSYGFWWVEWGGELDTIKDNEQIRDALYRIALGVWDHIKNGGNHGAENWALEWIGLLPGKRESRRFLGDHVLTQQDLEQAVLFPDRVAYGGWPIDTHPPRGIFARDEAPCEQPRLETVYSIPLRSLYSRNIVNLMMAGRNISATHLAFASARVMATCAVEGQAVGTAAAMAVQRDVTPRDLAAHHIAALQQMLLKDDAYIPHLANADPTDLSRRAAVRASSEAAGFSASNIIDGVTRNTADANHLWLSAPDAPLPQWVELTLPEPCTLQEVRLTFDTGLTRPLAFTYYEHLQARMIEGPQPETVRDYRIEVANGDAWETLVEVRGNYQRQRVHAFAPRVVRRVRITVDATNGARQAGIFEVRLY